MAVTAQTPFSQFTAAPGATVFSSEFRVLQASDLVVKVNGAVIAGGFSVSGIGAAGGVDVTFSTPMTGGEVVELLRDIPLTRATDYQQLGDFLSPVVNLDFDRLWMAHQGAGLKIGSSLRLPFPEQVQELPAAADRIRKLFYFDENGAPVMFSGTPGTVLGFNSSGDLVPVVPASGSAADLALNLASNASGKGAEMVAFKQTGSGAVDRKVSDELRLTVTPQQFGAKADNATDDIAGFDAALAKLRAAGGGILTLSGNYRISRPIRLCNNLQIKGSARILPTPGFVSSVVYPTFSTLVPQAYKCLAYFNEGTHADDPGNFGYSGLEIASSVIFDGQYHVEAPIGLIVEGMTNYKIECQFTQFATLGPWLKYYCWGGRLVSYVTNCRAAFAKLGPGSNGIDMNGFKGYGQADTPTHGLIIDGDNNGINLAGAFLEKVVNQILWVGLSGPASVSGIDFEVCSGTVITVDGTGLAGRQAGPVTVTGSFLEAGTSCVKAVNAVVIVQGCRLRNSPLAFDAVGVDARIYEFGNVIESSVTTLAAGNVVSTGMADSEHTKKTRAPWDADFSVKSSSTETVHAYSYNLTLPTATMKYSSQLADAGTQRMLTAAEWSTNEMRAGAVYATLGLKLDFLDGVKKVVPVSAGDTDLGNTSLPFNTVAAKRLLQQSGVGVGVNPDANGELVFQFTSNTQVSIKARGSDGIVRTGNITLA